MLKIVQCSVLFILLATFAGCYSFQDRGDADASIPGYWTTRDYVANAGPLNTRIDYFAGRVTYKGGDNQYHFSATPVFKGTPSIKVATVQSAFNYHAAIDNKYSFTAQLPVLSVDPSGEYMYDYEITDIANVIVPDENVPSRDDVKGSLPAGFPTTTPVWWVSVVGLSTVRIEQGKTLGNSGTVTGNGFSVNGSVANTDNIATDVPLVSILVAPMNAAADAVIAGQPPAQQLPVPPAHFAEHLTLNLSALHDVLSVPMEKPIQWTSHLEHNKLGFVQWSDKP